MNHGNHLKQMLIVGGVILTGLLVFGVPTSSALLYAALLACPLGMMAMMYFMNRGDGHSGHAGHAGRAGHGDQAGHSGHVPVAGAAARD